jgi:guanylate kinase
MRDGEVDGRDYYFLSEATFREKVAHGEFVEHEEVYAGTLYGTLKSEIERIWNKGQHVIFDIDVVGALNIKKMFGAQALAIVVMPPSVAVLRERLTGRGSETKENLERRIGKAERELALAPEFDHQLVNDQLEGSVNAAYKLVSAFISNPS